MGSLGSLYGIIIIKHTENINYGSSLNWKCSAVYKDKKVFTYKLLYLFLVQDIKKKVQ